MEFEFNLDKKSYRKQLEGKYFKTSLIYLAILTIVYFVFFMPEMESNWKVIILVYLIYAVVLLLLMYLINKLFVILTMKMNKNILETIYGKYKVKIDKGSIIETNGKLEEKILFDEIKTIKHKKNKIEIMSFRKTTYYKTQLGNESFDKLSKYLKSI